MSKTSAIDWIILDEVDSTNRYARDAGIDRNTAVLARRQSAGKGRDGRRFVSSEGGMYLSLVRFDALPVGQGAKYALAAPLAVCETLRAMGISAAVKWPNDVWVGQAKIAGVLIETEWRDGLIARAIVGIGLNVNNDLGDVPCRATSLCALLGRPQSVDEIAKAVAAQFDRFMQMDLPMLVAAVKRKMLTLGRIVVLADGREGVAVDLLDDARLVVDCGSQRICVAAGDVSLKEGLC